MSGLKLKGPQRIDRHDTLYAIIKLKIIYNFSLQYQLRYGSGLVVRALPMSRCTSFCIYRAHPGHVFVGLFVMFYKERIAKSHGSQCGFCTPGIVMSMYALLRNNPVPTHKEMESAFEGNLGQCM